MGLFLLSPLLPVCFMMTLPYTLLIITADGMILALYLVQEFCLAEVERPVKLFFKAYKKQRDSLLKKTVFLSSGIAFIEVLLISVLLK